MTPEIIMDFVRKNLGFVIFMTVGVVLLIALLVLDRKAAADLAESKEKSDSQQDFIEQVSRGEYALSDENLKQARRNHEIAETELNDFLRTLEMRYTLPRREMVTGVECITTVRQSIRDLQRLLEQRDIQTAAEQSFSFRELAASNTPPESRRVPDILKQLDVATIIVQAAADSYVSQFHSLRRLRNPSLIAEEMPRQGGAQTALYRVSVSGTGSRLRAFINELQQQQRVLLLIKHVKCSREKQPLLRLSPEEAESRRANERPPEMLEYPEGAYPPGIRSGRRRPRTRTAEGENAETSDGPLPRRERKVFDDTMPLQATITLGLLEFRATDEAPERDEG